MQSTDANRLVVVVTDVHMPFWSMVTFMVKWAFASIPAILIISFFWTFIWYTVLTPFLPSSMRYPSNVRPSSLALSSSPLAFAGESQPCSALPAAGHF